MIPSEHLQESVSAVAGALVSTTALYPLEIIKLHLVSEVRAGGDASSLKILLQLLKEDGFGALYQGLLSKCAHTTVQTFGYFYAYSCIKSFFANDEADMGAAGSLVSGYLAAVANLGVNMPLEVVSLRLQLQRGDRLSLLEALRTIFQKEGIPGFYRGITTNVLLCVNPAINYAAFEQLKRMVLRYRRNGSSSLNAMEAFIIGLAAKTIATLVTYPLVRAKILQQKQEDESSSVPKSMLQVLSYIYKTEGLSGFYKALWPQLLRTSLASALMLTAKEQISMYTFFFVYAVAQLLSKLRRKLRVSK